MWRQAEMESKKEGAATGIRRSVLTLALCVGLSAALCVGLSVPAFGEPMAFTVSSGHLLLFDVETGAVEGIGPIGLPGLHLVTSLTLSPSGELYSTGRVENRWELLRLDTETGFGTVVGFLDIDGWPRGLAFDPRGRLWLATSEAIYLVDSGTGAATLWAVPERPIETLAVKWKQMFVFTLGDDLHRLERLNPETGKLTPMWDVDVGLLITGSSFDKDGTLWFVARSEFAPLPFTWVAFYRMPDLSTGEVELGFSTDYELGDPLAGIGSLALPQWPGQVESQR